MSHSRNKAAPPCVLTIAGSDSGGGAGIQADLKTFAAHGCHGLSVITAITAQNTRAVTSVHAVPPREIERQIDAVFDDFDIRVVKLGMLGQSAAVRTVARALEARGALTGALTVVLDPVMIATSGARLLEPRAVALVRDRLLPLATIVTPNLPEAEVLVERPVTSLADMAEAAATLRQLGAGAALVKGGHRARGPVVDLLLDERGERQYVHRRLRVNAHGTGCTLASAIAAQLALGRDLRAAVAKATDYIHRALVAGYRPGRSNVTVLRHR